MSRSGQHSRRTVGRPPVPTERIVEAALEVVDEGGAEALSMRSVAQRLNSSTATLYRHFPNRASLVDALIDRVIGEIGLYAEELGKVGWEQACRSIATDYFEALGRHRSVAILLADHTPMGPNAAAVRERWLAVMFANDFPVDLAVRSGALMSSYVQGFAIQLAGQRVAEGLDDTLLPAAYRKLDPAAFPATAAALRAGARPVPLEEEFAFGLDLLLQGLRRLREGR